MNARGIDCEKFTIKKLSRNQLKIDSDTFLVGDNQIIGMVLKRIGYKTINGSYPKSLEKYLRREIWTTTIQKLLSRSNFEEGHSIFIKPKSSAKLFTGFVLKSNLEALRLESYSKQTELYCSALVNWVSEYRVFVNNAVIVGIRLYTGNENVALDMGVVQEAIDDFENSEEKTIAYGIDFGVLASGQTALVEWNDGFALGSYGLEKETYTNLLIARWEEILKGASANIGPGN